MRPKEFETINTGWTIRLNATPSGQLIALSGKAEYVEAELMNGGYGAVAGMLAYALRRAESIEPARQLLLTLVERFPTLAVVHYNLACYECQLGNLDAAKERLKTAFKLDSALRLQALEDADLEALWSGL